MNPIFSLIKTTIFNAIIQKNDLFAYHNFILSFKQGMFSLNSPYL